MRSTSSARRALALLLCLALTTEGSGGALALAATESPVEPCLLLKYIAPSVSEASARLLLATIPSLLQRDLGVRWVAPPAAAQGLTDLKDLFPEADDASLERISGKMAEVLRSMDRMETRKAAVLLLDAEGEARKFRLGDATRPFFAEIFLRRGLLHLWEGDRGKAEEMFARARVLRPDFSPDPGLFSPTFRDAWTRAGERPPPEADLLVQSIPPGASVFLDGKPVGTTPGRVKVSSSRPVRVRLALAGYLDVEKAGQWLPGDSADIQSVLVRDRVATLGELLTASPEGKGGGALIAELAAGAGALRVALMVLGERKGQPVVRVFTSGKGNSDPVFLGQFEWPAGDEGVAEAADRTAKLLRNAGWPAAKGSPKDAESPWFQRWWVWLLIGAVAIGVAAGAGGGGGGGSSGSSTGAIGVTF
jgi:hypothetical protein